MWKVSEINSSEEDHRGCAGRDSNRQELKAELQKIVSNAEIYEKAGSLQVKGIHSEKIKLWLRRLGL